jgi:hypothetical protein
MATIDPNIALGVRPIQIENPLNQMAAYSQIQGAQQGQQLNALKMKEAEREFGENEEIRNYLARADLNTPEGRSGLRRFGKTGLGYEKLLAEQEEGALKRTKLKGEISEQDRAESREAFKNILFNTSDENVLAHLQDSVKKGKITPEQAQQQWQSVASMDEAQRKQHFTMLSLKAEKYFELNKPTIQNITRGGISEQIQTPGLGGAPVVTRTADVTATPGDLMADARARERLKIEQQRLAADLDPNVQAKLAASKAAGTTAGKTQAAAAIALPNAIATSESLLGKIDAMIGTPAVKDKSGKVINAGTAPHPGFTGAVGMGRGYTLGIPGIEQLIPGTPAADFKARFDEIMGGAFLEAFETLKGGGAITETEGKKATAAKTRMSLAQSENEFLAAAREYKDIVKTGIERARKKAGQASSGGVDYDALVNKYAQ